MTTAPAADKGTAPAMADPDTGKATARDSVLAIIKEEHRMLGSVMRTLQQVVQEVFTHRIQADHALIACMLYYIDVFPERCHHPKEDEYLFRSLRERTSSADAVLDELQAQHVRSAQMMAYLQQLFVHYLGGAPDGLRHFADAVESYAVFLWDHMEQEERRVLPLAEKYLQQSDWQAIDAAFRANKDPLGGEQAQQEFGKLRQRIVNLLPRKLKRH
jgi:hemerythrin-like domain-containing protein